jgi:hypothetical protein
MIKTPVDEMRNLYIQFLEVFDWSQYDSAITPGFVGPTDLLKKKEDFLNQFGWTYAELMKVL